MNKKKVTVFEQLCSYYGIQKSTAQKICADLGFSPNLGLELLTSDQKAKYYKICRKYPHGSRVLSSTRDNIKGLMNLGCVRGLRLKKKLPVRGQRTRTNAKTIKRWKP